jgi:hypothetical protein
VGGDTRRSSSSCADRSPPRSHRPRAPSARARHGDRTLSRSAMHGPIRARRCCPRKCRLSSGESNDLRARRAPRAGRLQRGCAAGVRSRGRAERSADPRQDPLDVAHPGEEFFAQALKGRRPSISAASAWWRSRSSGWLSSGRLSQRRSAREPIAVTQLSMTASSVASSRPVRLASSSRLRRVAASRMSASLRSSTVSARMWGSALFCVSRTYCSSAPAAGMASGSSSAPKPLRSSVPS